MPARPVYDQTGEARDLRNVLLFGGLSALVFGAMAVVGQPAGILDIPLFPNLVIAFSAGLVMVAGLLGLRLKRSPHDLALIALWAWTIIVTLAVHFTGGPQTPMPALYVLIAVAASFLLGRRGAMLIAGMGMGGYAIILSLEYTGVLPIVPIWRMTFEPRGREALLLINLITVATPTLVAASLAGTLAERLAERNRQSDELRQQVTERLASVQQANRQLRALQSGLSTFQSVLDLDETFRRIATAVCGLGYTLAYIATLDEERDCLEVRAPVSTLPTETIRATEALSGRSLAGSVFTRADSDNIGVASFLSGKVLVSENLYDFYRPVLNAATASKIAQAIKFGCGAALPLRVESRSVGTLFALTSRSTLTEADISLLQSFADQAGVALERARLFAEVRRGRDRLQAVLNSTRDGVMMFDREQKLTTANPAAADWLDIKLEALVGLRLNDVLAQLGRQVDLEPAELEALQTEYLNQYGAGRRTFKFAAPPYRYVELMCWPVAGEKGESSGQLMVLHDVTHQKELEAAREELTHMLVHDLRGPLSSIIAGLYLAKETVGQSDVGTCLQSLGLALESAEHLLELINLLLDVYKWEAGRMQLQLAPVDLTQLIPASVKPFEAAAQSDKIEIVVETPVNLASVPADAGALQRVLSNLVDNALKFTPAGGRVMVRAVQRDTWLEVSVADSGPGIPPEARARIFEKFAEVKGQKGKRRGTGLGLTFCKLAVEAHRGRIWVDCPPEGGTVFTFTLPLETPAQGDD